MNIEELWSKAVKDTEVLRVRAQDLPTFETLAMPYVFLGESAVNSGDTVVRKGHVLIERPALILPTAQLQGFEFEQEYALSDDAVLNFLLVRGARFPSLRYRHELSSLDVQEGSLKQSADRLVESLKRAEDIHTGVVIGPEDAWQFSVLILVGSLVIRSAEGDFKRLLDSWKPRDPSR